MPDMPYEEMMRRLRLIAQERKTVAKGFVDTEHYAAQALAADAAAIERAIRMLESTREMQDTAKPLRRLGEVDKVPSPWQQRLARMTKTFGQHVFLEDGTQFYLGSPAELNRDGGGTLQAICKWAGSLEDAVNAVWHEVTHIPPKHYLVTNPGSRDRKHWIWIGSDWQEVPPDANA